MTLHFKAWHVSLVILLAGAVMAAWSVRILFVDPVEHGPKIAVAVAAQQLPTATTIASASPEPAATAAPPQQVVGPTNREDCNAIRGTDYRSDAERTWYLANCVRT